MSKAFSLLSSNYSTGTYGSIQLPSNVAQIRVLCEERLTQVPCQLKNIITLITAFLPLHVSIQPWPSKRNQDSNKLSNRYPRRYHCCEKYWIHQDPACPRCSHLQQWAAMSTAPISYQRLRLHSPQYPASMRPPWGASHPPRYPPRRTRVMRRLGRRLSNNQDTTMTGVWHNAPQDATVYWYFYDGLLEGNDQSLIN
jgi:hypothetical protein